MKVALGAFARSGIEARHGADIEAGLDIALRHCAERIASARQLLAIPRFLREAPPTDPSTDEELAVEPELERILEQEVRRQGVPVEQVVSHAVLVFLADTDEVDGDQEAPSFS